MLLLMGTFACVSDPEFELPVEERLLEELGGLQGLLKPECKLPIRWMQCLLQHQIELDDRARRRKQTSGAVSTENCLQYQRFEVCIAASSQGGRVNIPKHKAHAQLATSDQGWAVSQFLCQTFGRIHWHIATPELVHCWSVKLSKHMHAWLIRCSHNYEHRS